MWVLWKVSQVESSEKSDPSPTIWTAVWWEESGWKWDNLTKCFLGCTLRSNVPQLESVDGLLDQDQLHHGRTHTRRCWLHNSCRGKVVLSSCSNLKNIKRRLSTSTASSGFESRKVSIESSSSSMSASTVGTEEEDFEEESAVTRVKSDQHLDQLLNGELKTNAVLSLEFFPAKLCTFLHIYSGL